MDTNNITLFVGNPIEVASEAQLIARLRADLEHAGVDATLYASFQTLRRNERQIDLLVRCPDRTAHVEIKALAADLPVIARPNGPWQRRRSDGTVATEGNHGKQALDGTHAISDSMKVLARCGEVADRGDFKLHIDGIICVWPEVPTGSDIDPPKHITVVGYDQLVERLLTPGPKLDWSDDDWAAFARGLNLYQPEPETPAEEQRRIRLDQVKDYRARAHAAFSATAGPHIDTHATTTDGTELTLDDVDQLVAAGGLVVLRGPSGTGKSSAANQLAVRHCDRGRLVIRARCGEYEQGRLGELLNRSAAPYSAERRSDLVAAALEAGAGVTLILDGLDECPERLRDELVGQVSAFRLRAPVAVLLTANVDVAALDPLAPVTLTVGQPDARTRREILLAHGCDRPELIGPAFRTPYELSIAATVAADLQDDARVADVHDAYVRRFANGERVRDGLRSIAATLHRELRTSLPLPDVTNLLAGDLGGSRAGAAIDEILDCSLLVIERNRVRFTHPLLGTFLAADALVQASADGKALGTALSVPANNQLLPDALTVERDPRRRWEAALQYGNADLLSSVMQGTLGEACRELAIDEMRGALRRATELTRPDLVRFEPGDFPTAEWVHTATWTRTDALLLSGAGAALAEGFLADEVTQLLDATDVVCAHTISELGAAMSDPTSIVVDATYPNTVGRSRTHALPATFVARGCEATRWIRRHPGDPRNIGGRLVEGATDASYGRLHVALVLSDPRHPDDQAAFASLLERSWNSGAHTLQLEALQRAKAFSHVPEPARTEILAVVESIHPEHWWSKSVHVEVLADFGAIRSDVSVEDLQESIRDFLARPDDPEAKRRAWITLASRYDDPEIVGPFEEAVERLDPTEKALLLLMAIESDRDGFWLSHDLADLAQLVPTTDETLDRAIVQAFRERAGVLDDEGPMPTEVIAAAVAATVGWAGLRQGPLPGPGADASAKQVAWHHLMSLVLALHDGPTDDLSAAWAALQVDPAAAIQVLARIRVADQARAWGTEVSLSLRLLTAWREDFRPIVAWAVLNPQDAKATEMWLEVHPFAVDALGEVGGLEDVESLKPYTLDPDVGALAVGSIRRIHERHGA